MKIVFTISENNLFVSILNKEKYDKNLNDTNIINTKEIYFSSEYIKENLELVSSFLNVIIIKQNVNKVIINDYSIILLVLDIIKYIPSIKELRILPDKVLSYEMFLKILDNHNLTKINAFDIPKYLLERLDINKTIDVELRCELLFISNFMESNNLNTFSDLYYKKSIVIATKFDDYDINDFLSFIKVNRYLKQIEFKCFDYNGFNLIMDELLKNDKNNIKVIFDEKEINLNDIIKYVGEYKNTKENDLKRRNITFKINYSDEYKWNNTFKQINLNVIKIGLLSVILIVSIMMGINLFNNFRDTKKSDVIEKRLSDIMSIDTEEVDDNSQEDNIQYIEPNNDDLKLINTTTTSIYDIKYKMVFNELKEINDDTVGWLKVNNTNIDYPVVQGKDNDYYLLRDYYKNKNRHGWVFMDYRNNPSDLSRNTIIYGHNLANQKMFGTLRYALNSSWYKKTNNQIIIFNTISKNMRFQIFSIYKVPVTTDYLKTHFENDEDYMDFINMVESRSIYDFGVDINKDDKILTLSTCSNGHDQRLVVHAKLIIDN